MFSSSRDAPKVSPEVVLRNQTVNKSQFTLKNLFLRHFVSHYFYKGCGKMAQLKTINNSRTNFPAPRTIVSRNFYFFLRMLLLHPLPLRTIRRLILKFCLGFEILPLFRISTFGFRIFNRQEVILANQPATKNNSGST